VVLRVTRSGIVSGLLCHMMHDKLNLIEMFVYLHLLHMKLVALVLVYCIILNLF
jgi:hypothetical protein